MDKWIIRKPRMLYGQETARFSANVVATIAISIAIQIAYTIASLIIIIPVMLSDLSWLRSFGFEGLPGLSKEPMSDHTLMLLLLFSFVFLIAFTIIHVRFLEKRRISTIGLIKERSVIRYLQGFAIGGVLLVPLVIIMLISEPVSARAFQPVLFVFLLAFMVQSAGEEFLFRGFLVTGLTRRIRILPAVLLSSAVFTFAHLGNDGVTVLSLIQIFVLGALFAFLMLRTNSLLIACGAHAAWNFILGLITPIDISIWRIDYSIISFGEDSALVTNTGFWGSAMELIPIGIGLIAIALILFAGENRLVVHVPYEKWMAENALRVAVKAHRKEVDAGGTKYIHHPIAVSQMVSGDVQKTVALLHDVCDGWKMTPDKLKELGFTDEVVDAIEAMSAQRGEPFEQYVSRVRNNSLALAVKIADLTHNLDASRYPHPTMNDIQRMDYQRQLMSALLAEPSNT